MSSPTLGQVHVNVPMTAISVGYTNRRYIAERALPPVPVQRQANKYFVFTQADWFRDEAGLRAPGTRSRRGDYTLSTDSYSCDQYTFAKAVPDEIRKNADNPLRPDIEATELATERILLALERRVAALVGASGSWASGHSTTLSGTSQWSDYSNSTPITDIEAGKAVIHGKIGRTPNVLILGKTVFDKLKHHPTLIDRVKYSQRGVLTEELLAQLFSVESVLVGEALVNTERREHQRGSRQPARRGG
jgi:hypothetical protein